MQEGAKPMPAVSEDECAFSVGETCTEEICLTEDAIREMARLSGDLHPLHHDPEFARQSRFGSLIACGGHVTAVMMGVVSRFLTERGAGLGTDVAFKLRKAAPANVPLLIRWEIAGVEPHRRAGLFQVTLEGALSRHDGVELVTGTVNCIVSRDQFY